MTPALAQNVRYYRSRDGKTIHRGDCPVRGFLVLLIARHYLREHRRRAGVARHLASVAR